MRQIETLGKLGNIALLVLFAVGTSLLAFTLNIWLDEASSIYTTSRDLRHAFTSALNYEAQAPGYFVVLWFFRQLVDAPEAARLLSILAILGAVAITLKTLETFSDRAPQNLITALLVSNPYLIWAALEARPYALVIFYASLLLLLSAKIIVAETQNKRLWIAYGLVSIIGIYTLYHFGAVVLASGIAIACFGNAKSAARIVPATLVAVGIAFVCLPLLWVIPEQVSAYVGNPDNQYAALSSVKSFFWRLHGVVFAGPYGHPDWLALFLKVLLLAWLGVAALALFLYRDAPVMRCIIPIFFIGATACLVYLAAAISVSPVIISSRYLAPLAAPLLLCLAVLAGGPKMRTFVVAMLSVSVFCNGCILTSNYRDLAKTGDWHRLSEHLLEARDPTEKVFLFKNDAIVVLKLYFPVVDTVIQVPRDYPFLKMDRTVSRINSTDELISSFEKNLRVGESFWVVKSNTQEWQTFEYGMSRLNEYLGCTATNLGRQSFKRSMLEHYEFQQPWNAVLCAGETTK